MSGSNYILFSLIEKYRNEKYRITVLADEPRSIGDRNYLTPGGNPTNRIEVQGGWNAVIFSEEEKRFWLLEIEGPDHGVHFYGPFDEKDLPEATEE